MVTIDKPIVQNLPQALYSTRGLPRTSQVEAVLAYDNEFARIVPSEADPASGFDIEDRLVALGSMIVGTRRIAASSYVRSAAEIRRNPIDHFCFFVCRYGKVSASQNIQSGNVIIHDHGQPYEASYTDCEESAVVLPREIMGKVSVLAEALNARSIPGPLPGLLADHIHSLANRMSEFTLADAPHVIAATQAMIAACLAPTRDALIAARAPVAEALIQRVKRHVEEHLHDPSLSVDQICRIIGISRRQVYRLFEPCGGVERYIKRRRLAYAHARLADPGEVRRVKEIGYDLGFSSAAEFSRSFRQAFGYSPREVREAIVTKPHPLSPRPRTEEGALYSDLLRQICSPQTGYGCPV
ncbi:helix-turn-helix domain-containing protein [Inquilinus sp. NPDC058860]|uniref:helix-turn-helix domain-containing protein n=1 Tax=Inquilinus sp. NPDC058860 TaxID=3346652 RepID=UPI0036BB6101